MRTTHTFKIYCAGPLFNSKEKEEMAEIATALEKSGFEVFLPHRDGFEFANLLEVFRSMGVSKLKASRLLNKAVFTLDVYEVLNSDGLILNINGRVPDEGATVEAGIAWSAGKRVVVYKNDARTLLSGTDNPLLLGLSDFVTTDDIPKIPTAFQALFNGKMACKKAPIDNARLNDFYQKGQSVSKLAQNGHDKTMVCRELMKILGES
jgi:nucleoside 2-deoxyribosyltransferase